jgi:hypothetical protein
MKHNISVVQAPSTPSGSGGVRQWSALWVLILSQGALAPAGAADASSGFFVGAGAAAVHGHASASGSLSESEWDNSAALRLSLGYSAPVSQAFSLGAEVYDYPTHASLGLGDKTTQTFGVALLPAYAVLPDTKVFLSLGYERAHTNSPVHEWRDFGSRAPVFGGGISHSLAQSWGKPVSVTARIEQANYEKLTYLPQTDQFRQTRYILEAEFHF